MEHGYDKDALKRRLHRIEGQVRGVERMVDDDRYCIDILTQIGAIRTALESVGLELLGVDVSGRLELGLRAVQRLRPRHARGRPAAEQEVVRGERRDRDGGSDHLER